MAANREPIYPLLAKVGFGPVVTANTAKDGTGTVVTVFTAGAEGARLDRIKVKSLGTNVASVARFFLNNGSTNATAGNNSLLGELSLPAIANSEVAAQVELEWLAGFALPAGYKINVTIGTSVAAGWQFTGIGGDF